MECHSHMRKLQKPTEKRSSKLIENIKKNAWIEGQPICCAFALIEHDVFSSKQNEEENQKKTPKTVHITLTLVDGLDLPHDM